jgi:hypothetical protein
MITAGPAIVAVKREFTGALNLPVCRYDLTVVARQEHTYTIIKERIHVGSSRRCSGSTSTRCSSTCRTARKMRTVEAYRAMHAAGGQERAVSL